MMYIIYYILYFCVISHSCLLGLAHSLVVNVETSKEIEGDFVAVVVKYFFFFFTDAL